MTGTADYVAAPNRRYLDNLLRCVVAAKKDDFEQGLAQCLVEMKACQWNSEHAGNKIDIYGIVTNGDAWRFYKFSVAGLVYKAFSKLKKVVNFRAKTPISSAQKRELGGKCAAARSTKKTLSVRRERCPTVFCTS